MTAGAPASPLHVILSEWQRRGPADDERLRGARLGSPAAERLAAELTESGRLEVLELARGLSVQARSFVGTVRLGDVQITVQPKLPRSPLLRLLGYAYGLRDLHRYEEAVSTVELGAFQELLVYQLVEEATELVSRGLPRRYRREEAWLANPRGRIDLGRYQREAGPTRSVLPCTHYPRSEDWLPNQVLLAGLDRAANLTTHPASRRRLHLLAAALRPTVRAASLGPELWPRLERALDRTTAACEPALRLIRLLVEGQGVALEAGPPVPLPGFLFDMNRFFQTLMFRFLDEHLEGLSVRDEVPLAGLLRYASGENPRQRAAPSPRPDFSLYEQGRLVGLLDAKYRDLWERSLPREMLYQLTVYAMSQGPGGVAVILYPALGPEPAPATVEIRPPGGPSARVVLRPVDLLKLAGILGAAGMDRAAREYARWVAVGREGRANPRSWVSPWP